MARKRNEQKNGLDQNLPNNKKGVNGAHPLSTADRSNTSVKNAALTEDLPNGSHSLSKGMNDTNHVQDVKKSKKKKSQKKEKQDTNETASNQTGPCHDNTEVDKNDTSTSEAPYIRDESEMSPNTDDMNCFGTLPSGHVEYPETMVFKFIRTISVSIAKSSAEWVERQKPTFLNLKASTMKARDHVRLKVQIAKPIFYKWLMHIGSIVLLLSMVWLDCTIRGISSFLRLGTTSFFSLVWCSALSVIAMIGFGKFVIILVIAAAVGLFLGFSLALLLTCITGAVLLWFYGSFWTTLFIIILGGLAFLLSHDKIALFITSAYSIYCAWNYVGWLGLILGLNLSFISSDVLLFFMRNMINEQSDPNSSPEQSPPFFRNENVNGSSTETGAHGPPSDRNSGIPSTSGSDSDITSEDEIVRLLNCTDHYAAMGLSRFQNIDVSVIKREYRKKAMLVHPDKNMANEKAAEAFQKLQNAYEVLLDSFKRKEYDDELRRDELLNYFRKFQNSSHENKGHGFAHTDAGFDDPTGESRRISCRKCGFLHVWIYTNKLKSKARWCQECKDFHPAKDGDGWVEQTSQPFFFGILKKVDTPSAYICADGKVYNATEWYICQGMRCHANSHKPSFHVNTNVVSKNSHTKGTSSGQKGSGIPTPNMDETMTEEEFFEWLQNAAQSGAFENFPGASGEAPPGFNPKSGGSNSNSAGSKRKKKGKKQW